VWYNMYCVGTSCYSGVTRLQVWYNVYCVGTSCYLGVTRLQVWYNMYCVGTSFCLGVIRLQVWYNMHCVGTSCYSGVIKGYCSMYGCLKEYFRLTTFIQDSLITCSKTISVLMLRYNPTCCMLTLAHHAMSRGGAMI
jgi:hypothetical protein